MYNVTSAGDQTDSSMDQLWSPVNFSSNVTFIMNVTTSHLDELFLDYDDSPEELNNWWALLALVLVLGTAAGNILVCLAITWERRLQNVTNYFLMSLAITDLMVAILVMPLGILTLFRGHFPLPSIYCLAWICLDVLFCTASIMHLCTISVDRYLSLRYPMKFGRNKSRRRVTLKIVFVWLLSIAMSLPLSLMYSKNHDSVIKKGECQIPDPLYKFIGSIICFYIPLIVMLLTYALTVRLLADQRQNLGTGSEWSNVWMGGPNAGFDRRYTWRRLLKKNRRQRHQHQPTTPQHGHHGHHSAGSTDTELTTIDTHELWIQESEPPAPCTMSALGQFGAEMLKLSRGLEAAATATTTATTTITTATHNANNSIRPPRKFDQSKDHFTNDTETCISTNHHDQRNSPVNFNSRRRRRASTYHVGDCRLGDDDDDEDHRTPLQWRRSNSTARQRNSNSYNDIRSVSVSASDLFRMVENESSANHAHHSASDTTASSCHTLPLPPPCTCPYFGDKQSDKSPSSARSAEVRIIPVSDKLDVTQPSVGGGVLVSPGKRALLAKRAAAAAAAVSMNGDVTTANASPTNIVVTWEAASRRTTHRRGSSFGSTKTSLLSTNQRTPLLLRRSATLRQNGHGSIGLQDKKSLSSTSYSSYNTSSHGRGTTIRSHHSRNSSVISRNSSRHGRIIRLEQKATKVLGVVFFTFVILWAPFFVLNLLPVVCGECEQNIDSWVFQFVTWLGYASSLVNPIFYTIFNKVFRQAFKKVLVCGYRNQTWRPHR